MMERVSQCAKIYNYMKLYGSITPNEADRHFRCKRLASRISDMKSRGMKIKTTIVTAKNYEGEKVRFARYELEDEKQAYVSAEDARKKREGRLIMVSKERCDDES